MVGRTHLTDRLLLFLTADYSKMVRETHPTLLTAYCSLLTAYCSLSSASRRRIPTFAMSPGG